MRKRTINNLWDTIFWGVVYLAPLIIFLSYLFTLKSDWTVSFSNFMYQFIDQQNPILELFNNFIGSSDFTTEGGDYVDLHLLGWDSPIVLYLAYCATVTVAHVFFDIVVFIPRLAHKWLGKATQQD